MNTILKTDHIDRNTDKGRELLHIVKNLYHAYGHNPADVERLDKIYYLGWIPLAVVLTLKSGEPFQMFNPEYCESIEQAMIQARELIILQ